jgi:hypothetical protein
MTDSTSELIPDGELDKDDEGRHLCPECGGETVRYPSMLNCRDCVWQAKREVVEIAWRPL